jgi:hypothetical protein
MEAKSCDLLPGTIHNFCVGIEEDPKSTFPDQDTNLVPLACELDS